MTWIWLVLGTHFSWALSNIADKYVLGHRIQNVYIYMVWIKLFGFTSVLVLPFIEWTIPDARTVVYVLLAGFFFFLGGFPYAKAVQQEDVTRISVWWSLQPLWGILLGFFFGQTLVANQGIALVLLVGATFLAALHANKKVVVVSRSVLFMIICTLCFALYAAFLHEAAQHVSFLAAYVWTTLTQAVCGLVCFVLPKVRALHRAEAPRVNRRVFGLFWIVFLTANIGIFLNHWALSLQQASLVFAFEASQVLFTFLIVFVCYKINPALLRETFDRENVKFKIGAAIFMVLGVLVLTLF
jgi:drug/metabolite transporter (DMT)-like permease